MFFFWIDAPETDVTIILVFDPPDENVYIIPANIFRIAKNRFYYPPKNIIATRLQLQLLTTLQKNTKDKQKTKTKYIIWQTTRQT